MLFEMERGEPVNEEAFIIELLANEGKCNMAWYLELEFVMSPILYLLKAGCVLNNAEDKAISMIHTIRNFACELALLCPSDICSLFDILRRRDDVFNIYIILFLY
jgi:hypothetical protein